MKNDFLTLLDRLTKADVDFVVIGGFAGVVYGCSFVTQDIDICCNFSVDNLLRLQKALADLNPIHRMTPAKPKLELNKDNCSSFKNLYLDTDIGQLDCLGTVSSIGNFNKVKQMSTLVEFDNIKLWILNLDALIESKRAMNRPRDKEAVLQLEAIKKLKDSDSV